MTYSAFISYSHAADGKLAPALQNALHRFAKPWYRLRQVRAFRDKTNLSADPGLWSAIEHALQESDWFLLLASSDAAQSPWVQKEVAWWLEHKQVTRILIVLTQDELLWDQKTNDFDWERTKALPRVLAGRFQEEPLYVDLSWAKTQEGLSLRHSQFRAAVLDISAPLQGKSKDELDGEDVRQYRRTRRILALVTVLIAALAIVATWQAYVARQQRVAAEGQRDEARKQRDLADERHHIALSRQLAAQSLNIADARLPQAILLSLTGISIHSTQEAGDNFFRLMRTFALRATFLGTSGIGPHNIAFSPDGKMLAKAGYEPTLWDVTSAQPLPGFLKENRDIKDVAFSPDGTTLAGVGNFGTILLWDAATGDVRELADRQGALLDAVAFSSNGRMLATAGSDRAITVWNSETHQQMAEPFPGYAGRTDPVQP
jgi:hypothetical protein